MVHVTKLSKAKPIFLFVLALALAYPVFLFGVALGNEVQGLPSDLRSVNKQVTEDLSQLLQSN